MEEEIERIAQQPLDVGRVMEAIGAVHGVGADRMRTIDAAISQSNGILYAALTQMLQGDMNKFLDAQIDVAGGQDPNKFLRQAAKAGGPPDEVDPDGQWVQTIDPANTLVNGAGADELLGRLSKFVAALNRAVEDISRKRQVDLREALRIALTNPQQQKTN
jgi:hypothetical protein